VTGALAEAAIREGRTLPEVFNAADTAQLIERGFTPVGTVQRPLSP
jgi:hypothetical protein